MTVIYTFDVFSSLDGFGSHNGNWGGYWGKQGPGRWTATSRNLSTGPRCISRSVDAPAPYQAA